ncbi:hypothetical protein F5X68DRAFT_273409 [Plectosphaerella plurivora]|uniref:Ubiquitin carboxyl-terminal hydrolase n=1 Tax=Plectosphaerella plurivora TaxID=936078 RepID=A0A9P9AFS9_9PEZI|nr:hypothetical protein F5X68DRAFT_273409 [Plectosphaerella plurivora]
MSVQYNAAGKKYFVPLENNPQVFTKLAHDLGMDPLLEFHDVYSLDDPDLLAMVPRPAHALIFITPSNAYHAVEAEDTAAGTRDGPKPAAATDTEGPHPVLWFPQTIGNACGLIALLHSVLNGPSRERIVPGSPLADILREALALSSPDSRAELLYNSAVLEASHSRAAVGGDTAAPDAGDPIGYHFLAFVRGNDGNLWEFEGSFGGLICRGAVPEGEDMLGERVLEAGVRRFIKAGQGSAEFSIIALSERGQ